MYAGKPQAKNIRNHEEQNQERAIRKQAKSKTSHDRVFQEVSYKMNLSECLFFIHNLPDSKSTVTLILTFGLIRGILSLAIHV